MAEKDSDNINDAIHASGMIPFESLLGQPLSACVSAQKHAADVMWEYLRDVAFRHHADDADRLEAISVVFGFVSGGRMCRLSIPLLALIPVPYLQIQDVTLAFKSDVTATSEGKLVGKIANESSVTRTSKFNYQSNIKVNLKASAGNMPAGLAKILELCGNSCFLVQDVPDKLPPMSGSGCSPITLGEMVDGINRFSSQMSNANRPGILGVHVNWSRPYQAQRPHVVYNVDDFELLSTILSALLWRKYNGPIKLYTDNMAFAFYRKLGMLQLWDGGVDSRTLESIPSSIDPSIFWAAGKLFAIKAEKSPFALIDTDLLFWRSMTDIERRSLIISLHREPLDQYYCYIPFDVLKKRKGYKPHPAWDWNELPCNTAFSYFNHPAFQNAYVEAAIDFMTDNKERPMEMVSQMVFAEQRIYAMTAKRMKIPIRTLLKDAKQQEQGGVTHVWGNKQVARDNADSNVMLCRSLLQSIRKNFPEFVFSEELQRRFRKYSSEQDP